MILREKEKYFEEFSSTRKSNLFYKFTFIENFGISTLNGYISKIDEFLNLIFKRFSGTSFGEFKISSGGFDFLIPINFCTYKRLHT